MCQKNAGTHGFRRTKTVHLHFQETKHDGPYFNGIFTIISPKIGHLYLNGEDAGFHLVVPTLDPGVGADGLVHVLEVLAGFVLLATQLLALVEVHVAHLAPSGLVLVGVAGIILDSRDQARRFVSVRHPQLLLQQVSLVYQKYGGSGVIKLMTSHKIIANL